MAKCLPTTIPSGKIIGYRPARKLRSRHCEVTLRFQRKGEKKPDIISWAFKVDRRAEHLVFGAKGTSAAATGDGEGEVDIPGDGQ